MKTPITNHNHLDLSDLESELELLLAREKKLRIVLAAQNRVRALEAKTNLGPNVSLVISAIGELVCEEFGLRWNEIMAKIRIAPIVAGRQAICYFARIHGGSLTGIGLQLGLDHGTVSHAFNCVRDQISVDPRYKLKMEALGERIRADLLAKRLIEAIEKS